MDRSRLVLSSPSVADGSAIANGSSSGETRGGINNLIAEQPSRYVLCSTSYDSGARHGLTSIAGAGGGIGRLHNGTGIRRCDLCMR